MTEVEGLLVECAQLGVVLWADAEALFFDAPAGAVTDGLRRRLGDHKAELVIEVRRREAVALLSSVERIRGPGDWHIVEEPDGFDAEVIIGHAFFRQGDGEEIVSMLRRCGMG